METRSILIIVFCIGIILFFGKLFSKPIKFIIKLIINSCLGAFIIFVINLIGTSFNFHIGMNIINSIIVGILGIPGAVLLVIIKIFCF